VTPLTADRSSGLTLGHGASRARRGLGPIAWAVLECVAESAATRAGETVSYESVRGLADSLGLAKDTVARALRRLAAEQLVTYVASRDIDGRFGPSCYQLTFPPDLFLGLTTPATTAAPPKPIRPKRHAQPTQLSLMDALSTDHSYHLAR
jgi:DNA-binding transcriptional MocR family regulator